MTLLRYVIALLLLLAAPVGAECYPGLGDCETGGDTPGLKLNYGTPGQPLPEPLPTPQPTQAEPVQPPTPSNPICHVADVRPPDAWLAIRTEPSSKRGTRLAKLPSGVALEMLGQKEGNWYLVRLQDGTVGWVSWAVDRWIAC